MAKKKEKTTYQKPISLNPLGFEEALKDLLKVIPAPKKTRARSIQPKREKSET